MQSLAGKLSKSGGAVHSGEQIGSSRYVACALLHMLGQVDALKAFADGGE